MPNGAPMLDKIDLSPQAFEDIASLSEFTLHTFGARQAARYRDALFKSLVNLVAFPQIGTDQGRLGAGARRFVHASHAIYYRAVGERILVLRVLGPGQDPTREFE